MLTCHQCNVTFDDHEFDDHVCGNVGAVAQKLGMGPSTVEQRPSGSAPIIIGWLSLAASCLFFLMGNDNSAADAFTYLVASGAFFSLFISFWSVGYIVRAISFLPGKDIN